MGFMSAIKANKALRLQKNRNYAEAAVLYEEAFAEGVKDPRYMLPYALMIIREGQYEKAKNFLVANQKMPMSPGQRTEMLVYYATCCFRLGSIDKGINTLEQQFRKAETGLLYQTLGYLYVEKYDQAHRPDFQLICFPDQYFFKLRIPRIRIPLIYARKQCPFGEICTVIKCTAKPDADDHRRTGIRSGQLDCLQHKADYAFFSFRRLAHTDPAHIL